MAGGVLEIVGLLALLAGSCELLRRRLDRQHDAAMFDLSGYRSLDGDAPCPWPQPEPELDMLRRKGAL